MAEPAKSWLGNMLASISSSSTPRPDTDEKLVEIPHGTEKLRKAIITTQRVELELQAKEARYANAWKMAEDEYRVACEQLKMEQDDVALRLKSCGRSGSRCRKTLA